jgi:hypothetical protein
MYGFCKSLSFGINCQNVLSCGLLFHITDCTVWSTDILNVAAFQFIFILSFVLLISSLRNCCLAQGHKGLLLLFSSIFDSAGA